MRTRMFMLALAFLLLCELASAESVTTFNDTTTAKNFSQVGTAWTNLTYLKIPKYATVYDSEITLRPFNLSEEAATYEENAETTNVAGSTSATMTLTYRKNASANNNSVWQTKYYNVLANYTLPSDCWNMNTTHIILQVLISTASTEGNIYLKCYNGTSYNTLTSTGTKSTTYTNTSASSGMLYDGNWTVPVCQYSSWYRDCGDLLGFYEEAVWWKINATTPESITMDVGDDGSIEFSNATMSSQSTVNITSSITSYLSSCTVDTSYFCDVPLNLSGYNGILQAGFPSTNYSEIPMINITSPINGSTTDSPTPTVNYTLIDSNVDSCWYRLDEGANTTTLCDGNFTISASEGDHNVTVWSNDTSGNTNSSSTQFTVGLLPPTILLDYPTSTTYIPSYFNIWLNYTCIDPNGLSLAEVWHNMTGTWHKNSTNTAVVSGLQNGTLVNASSDGVFAYNVFCNDTTESGQFRSTNVTFTVDTTPPLISALSLTTTVGSQTVGFSVSYTEVNCNSTFYSVFMTNGSVENGLLNVSSVCGGFSGSFVVTAYGTYNFTAYVKDMAGAESTNSTLFTVTSSSGGGGGAGGGAPPQPTPIQLPNATYLLFPSKVAEVISGKDEHFNVTVLAESNSPYDVVLSFSVEDACGVYLGGTVDGRNYEHESSYVTVEKFKTKEFSFQFYVPANYSKKYCNVLVRFTDANLNVKTVTVRVWTTKWALYFVRFLRILYYPLRFDKDAQSVSFLTKDYFAVFPGYVGLTIPFFGLAVIAISFMMFKLLLYKYFVEFRKSDNSVYLFFGGLVPTVLLVVLIFNPPSLSYLSSDKFIGFGFVAMFITASWLALKIPKK